MATTKNVMDTQFRLRLRLPSGAELEVYGDPEYIRSEKEAFLSRFNPQNTTPERDPNSMEFRETPAELPPGRPKSELSPRSPIWNSLTTNARSGDLQLRAKLSNDRTDKDACLLLLAAAQKVLNISRPTASQLARWLRASGYPIQRVDRVISEAIQKGEILASGSRRARRYELTGAGRLKGFLLAEELSSIIRGE